MDLRRLRYFVVLAETLHFGRAALRLSIAQPPLSHQIRVLEEELGARLFDRNNRRVELTAAGMALLPEARALLAQAEKASTIAARVERGELGELRIGFTSAAALTQVIPRLILAYRRDWPGVRLSIRELTTQEQLTAMLERRLDFAFVRGTAAPDLPPAFGAVRLFEDAFVVALPPQHPCADNDGPLFVKALANEPFVMYPPESGTGAYEQVLSLCRHAGFAPQVVQEALSAATMVGLVAAGLGVALVPESFQRIEASGVAFRALRDSQAKSAMWLVFRADEVSVREAAFLELAGVIKKPRRSRASV
ncbi:LysR substrate-binding domain-containing protein [Ralstonia pseudosolanacearum]|uniref:LysR substrate-binding domain-containing protein n=1 Tax=Ralstonia pseudosolanacearum TaxID=1310165 RepID=UPI001865D7DB|nr:LysR substrate-binding domain-containing protein [Ralstonia pseudosolanacearum]MDC6293788.1 LysR substrate-binding domain-containing protein [Ralstonia pseudosolanacearum]MDD7788675.1 LysR substrate-binding domain-containing protein [Ralstonia pseudosolanacearum]MDN3366505.1 LysR substrate-binding domain-containing protein [Ralstonia pseudosolanacearum]QOK89822.1 LysR family transcriptional regulator [Ralstonia pseudosolanacearum]